MDREDLHRIRKYTFRSELDKALHSLEGIIKGITIDKKVTQEEIEELRMWGKLHYEFIDRHPFNELVPLVLKSVSDNKLDPEEVQDILWLSKNIRTDSIYYNALTSDIQRLEGILHGILADNAITDAEIDGLSKWLFDNEQLRGTYPFDELCSLVTSIKQDGKIDDMERNTLKLFIADFVDTKNMIAIDKADLDRLKKEITVQGVCALDPEISFLDRLYCITGVFRRSNRSEIVSAIEANGGTFKDNVVKETNYLVIGSAGNPCWAFSCYGRKVEKAVQMRKQGLSISIVNEIDFWDALQ